MRASLCAVGLLRHHLDRCVEREGFMAGGAGRPLAAVRRAERAEVLDECAIDDQSLIGVVRACGSLFSWRMSDREGPIGSRRQRAVGERRRGCGKTLSPFFPVSNVNMAPLVCGSLDFLSDAAQALALKETTMRSAHGRSHWNGSTKCRSHEGKTSTSPVAGAEEMVV